jgi:hypothetical protein
MHDQISRVVIIVDDDDNNDDNNDFSGSFHDADHISDYTTAKQNENMLNGKFKRFGKKKLCCARDSIQGSAWNNCGKTRKPQQDAAVSQM